MGKHLVDLSSKKPPIITHSTAEAEYLAAYSATRMIVLFRRFWPLHTKNKKVQQLYTRIILLFLS